MTIDPQKLRIVKYPDPILRKKAQKIDPKAPEIAPVVHRMIELMHEASGVGLAAPQVGLPWRLFVASYSGEAGDEQVFINPVLREPSRELELVEEGCLSLPGVQVTMRRPKGIVIQATDLKGEQFALQSEEFPARVWQHEYDHLEGVLIIDRMSAVDARANKRAIRELEADA